MADDDERGFQQLFDDLAELPAVVAKTIIPRALRKAALPIKEEGQRRAPDDPDTPGSRIADSFEINVTEQTSSGAIALIGPSKKGFVGLFAEFGTAHQAAKPFLGPAYDLKEDQALDILAEELGSEIEKTMRKK